MQKTTLAKMISASLFAVALTACGSTGSVNLTPEQLQAKQDNSQAVGFYVLDELSPNGKKVESGQITINGKTYTGTAHSASNLFVTPLNINDFKQGFSENTYEDKFTNKDKETTQHKGVYKVYNQPFSFVFGDYMTQFAYYGEKDFSETDSRSVNYGGLATTILPTNVAVTYRGLAFNKAEKGALEYTINYGSNNSGSGSGKITGIASTGDITLEKGDIDQYKRYPVDYKTGNNHELTAFGIVGQASFAKGGNKQQYELDIYGPNGTEIAGLVNTNNTYKDDSSGQIQNEAIVFAGQK